MAIINIEIVQDNIVGDCDLLSVASPLVYLVNATYTGAVPDVIYARLFNGETDLGYYKCLPWKDLSSTVRQFWFRADEILRQHVPLLEDVTQSDNTLIEIDGAVKGLTLKFCDTYRDDLGIYYKDGNLEGLVLPNPNYFINFGVEINGVPYVMNFIIPEPMTLTNSYMIERFIEQLNIYAPGAYGASVLVAASAYGFRITNNTTSNPSIMVSSIGGVTQEASFPAPVILDATDFHAINAAGRFGETEANLPIFNNEQQSQIGVAGKHAYAYFYSKSDVGMIDVVETLGTEMRNEFDNDNDFIVSSSLNALTLEQISQSVIRFRVSSQSTEPAGGFAKVAFTMPVDITNYKISIVGVSGNFAEFSENLSGFQFGVLWSNDQFVYKKYIIPSAGEFNVTQNIQSASSFYVEMTKKGQVDDIYVDIDFMSADIDLSSIKVC